MLLLSLLTFLGCPSRFGGRSIPGYFYYLLLNIIQLGP